MEITDIKLIITYFEENGTSIYSTKYLGYDAGKNNLVGYFCNKLNWSKCKLKSTIKYMEDKLILKYHPTLYSQTRLLSLSMLMSLETHLKL